MSALKNPGRQSLRAVGGGPRIARALVILSLLAGAAVLAGCIHTEVVPLDASGPYAAAVEPEILSQRPDRPFKEIALVESQGSVSGDDLLRRARKKAGALGADAIIVLPKEQKQGSGGLLFPVVKVIAIKYE